MKSREERLIKKGKNVVILESRKEYSEEPDAIAEESKKLINSFKKSNASGNDSIEDSFFDSDNLYVILASDMLKNSPENNLEKHPLEKKTLKKRRMTSRRKSFLLALLYCLLLFAWRLYLRQFCLPITEQNLPIAAIIMI